VRLLLDTQVALWWLGDSRRLSDASRELIAASPCVLSVASVWEVAIKHRIGKLAVAPGRFRDEMRSAGATILSVNDDHAIATLEHPADHFDPFDSLLLAVARTEHLVLLTADAALLALAQEAPGLPIKPV
jgi:PIN domain nuclease of toxin-antitoxin system